MRIGIVAIINVAALIVSGVKFCTPGWSMIAYMLNFLGPLIAGSRRHAVK